MNDHVHVIKHSSLSAYGDNKHVFGIDIHMYVVCRGENASESIQNGYLNLEQLGRSSVLAWPRMLTLERL